MAPIAPVPYDEFSLFGENADEFGIPYDGPPTVRRTSVDISEGRRLSALVWGDGPPELVLLHGGAQNAHTWDTVALALGRPLLALDLPGHGHSDAGREGSLDARDNARDVAAALRSLAPGAAAVAGMSLGGLTTLALYDVAPELVRRIVLVDITPGVTAEKSSAISAFVNGPERFDSFDDLLARTIEHNPTRSVSSLRRGILHNAVQLADGTWMWRYARHRALERTGRPNFTELWEVVSKVDVPLLLVRGMLAQSVVDDDDEAELVRRCPNARVEHIAAAGHSVQGDTPLELAQLVAGFIA